MIDNGSKFRLAAAGWLYNAFIRSLAPIKRQLGTSG
jgi:hypothetical protein